MTKSCTEQKRGTLALQDAGFVVNRDMKEMLLHQKG
jgi:hypothetical protein